MKQIVNHFIKTFELVDVNWPSQMLIAKSLLKHYDKSQILYAIEYYKRMGKELYSLSYLTKCMDKPIREMKAMQNISLQDGNSSDRNKRKFRENNEAFGREECFSDLFKKPD